MEKQNLETIENSYSVPLATRAKTNEGIETKIETVNELEQILSFAQKKLADSVIRGDAVIEKAKREVVESSDDVAGGVERVLQVEDCGGKADHNLGAKVYEAVKSWFVYAHNTEKCYKCGYCILSSRSDLSKEGVGGIESFINKEIGDVPAEIAVAMRDIPVSINNYFGDPGIQWEDTLSKLKKLEESGHSGPVGIISKSSFSKERAQQLKDIKCKVVILQSVSNLPTKIEPVSHEKRIESLRNLVEAGLPAIAYLRPLIPGYNAFKDIIRSTLDSVAQSGCKILCYSGLRGTSDVLKLLEKTTGEKIKPPEGYSNWQKDHKLIDDELQKYIEEYGKQLGLKVFRKTSCAVSYALGLDSDYNCHWAMPEKYSCDDCEMAAKCSKAASDWKPEKAQLALDVVGGEGEIEYSDKKGVCKLKDVCTSACTHCSLKGGMSLKLKGKRTLGELSLARWLSGIPTSADGVIDTPRIFALNVKKEVPVPEEKPKQEHFHRNPNESACPQGCAYCIVDLNQERKEDYGEHLEYFMNSFVAFNIPLKNREKHIEQLRNFDFELLRGDTVGFQGASEPLLFPKELDFICEKAREFGFKVAICTKAIITEEKSRQLFEKYGDVLKVEVSYAKLSELERTDKFRIVTIRNLIRAGFDPLVVIQPFIYGITDKRIDVLMTELQNAGAKDVCVNGFRYSKSMEGWAKEVLSDEWLKKYQEHEGVEWLPDRDTIVETIERAGFSYKKIGEWIKKGEKAGINSLSESEIADEIEKVKKLMKIPREYFREWKMDTGEILIEKRDIDQINLRTASDSNSECLEKTLSRRLGCLVKLVDKI